MNCHLQLRYLAKAQIKLSVCTDSLDQYILISLVSLACLIGAESHFSDFFQSHCYCQLR